MLLIALFALNCSLILLTILIFYIEYIKRQEPPLWIYNVDSGNDQQKNASVQMMEISMSVYFVIHKASICN